MSLGRQELMSERCRKGEDAWEQELAGRAHEGEGREMNARQLRAPGKNE